MSTGNPLPGSVDPGIIERARQMYEEDSAGTRLPPWGDTVPPGIRWVYIDIAIWERTPKPEGVSIRRIAGHA